MTSLLLRRHVDLDMTAIRGLSGVMVSLLARPILAWEALRTSVALRRRGRLGVSPDYLAWRLTTAYGSSEHPMEPGDLIDFLRWRRSMRAMARSVRAV